MYLNTRQIYSTRVEHGRDVGGVWIKKFCRASDHDREATPGRELDFRPSYWYAKTPLRVMLSETYQEWPSNHCSLSLHHRGVPSELDHDMFISAASAPAGSCVSRRIRSKAEPSSSSAGREGEVHCAHGVADTHGVGTSSGRSNIHFYQ